MSAEAGASHIGSMNISDMTSVQPTLEENLLMLALPLSGAALIVLAIIVAFAWTVDPDNDEFGLGKLKAAVITFMVLGGLVALVFGGGQHSEKNEPVTSANGEAVQDWAQETYGVAIPDDAARSAAKKAKSFPDKEQTLTVRGPDDKRLEVILKVEAGGELYLMDPATRAELASRP